MVFEPEGRFELPKPWGARPESVVFPCALHVLVELPVGRLVLLLKVPVGRPALKLDVPPVRPGCEADGGRFAFSADIRLELMPGFTFECADIEVFGVCDIAFIVCTPLAPTAGVVRAITLRFCTLFVGCATLLCALAAPK